MVCRNRLAQLERATMCISSNSTFSNILLRHEISCGGSVYPQKLANTTDQPPPPTTHLKEPVVKCLPLAGEDKDGGENTSLEQ